MFPLNVNVHLDVIQFPTFHRIQRKSQFNPRLSCPKVLGRKRKVAFCFFKGLSFPIQHGFKNSFKILSRQINSRSELWMFRMVQQWADILLKHQTFGSYICCGPAQSLQGVWSWCYPHVRVQTTQCSAGRVSQPPGVAPLHKCKERGGGRIAPTLIRTSRDLCVDTSHCIITMSETST